MADTTKSVAVYVRVSTAEQNTEGQQNDLRRWLDRNGMKADAVAWFIDKESGTKMSRDALDRLKAAIFNGEIRTVICWKLDRLARSMVEGMNLLNDWTKRGVRIVSITQQIDLSGTVGQMVAAVLMGFAQIETEYRRERQAVGIEAAKRKGGVYRGRKAGTTKGNPARARELSAKGLTWDEIATAMGCSARTVARYLAASPVATMEGIGCEAAAVPA